MNEAWLPCARIRLVFPNDARPTYFRSPFQHFLVTVDCHLLNHHQSIVLLEAALVMSTRQKLL